MHGKKLFAMMELHPWIMCCSHISAHTFRWTPPRVTTEAPLGPSGCPKETSSSAVGHVLSRSDRSRRIRKSGDECLIKWALDLQMRCRNISSASLCTSGSVQTSLQYLLTMAKLPMSLNHRYERILVTTRGFNRVSGDMLRVSPTISDIMHQ